MERAPDGTAFSLAGPEGAPAVALIHGLGVPRPCWEPFVAALAGRYRVLSYHLPGHGESAPTAGPLTLRDLAGQLRALMDFSHIARAAVVGFSLGGMINRRLALDHPDRVTALAILNSPHARGAEAQAEVEARARASAGGPAATLDAAIRRWFTPGFVEASPGTVAAVRASVLACHPASYAACRWVLARGVVELIRPAPPIACPALAMTCEHDTGSTPAMARAIAAEIAGAETVIVPGLQHMGLIERPELFAGPVAEFLDRHLLRTTPRG